MKIEDRRNATIKQNRNILIKFKKCMEQYEKYISQNSHKKRFLKEFI